MSRTSLPLSPDFLAHHDVQRRDVHQHRRRHLSLYHLMSPVPLHLLPFTVLAHLLKNLFPKVHPVGERIPKLSHSLPIVRFRLQKVALSARMAGSWTPN